MSATPAGTTKAGNGTTPADTNGKGTTPKPAETGDKNGKASSRSNSNSLSSGGTRSSDASTRSGSRSHSHSHSGSEGSHSGSGSGSRGSHSGSGSYTDSGSSYTDSYDGSSYTGSSYSDSDDSRSEKDSKNELFPVDQRSEKSAKSAASANSVISEALVELQQQYKIKGPRPGILDYRQEPPPPTRKALSTEEQNKRDEILRLRSYQPKSDQLLAFADENDLAHVKELLNLNELGINAMLFSSDMDPNAICNPNHFDDALGETALIRACKYGYFSMVKFLLSVPTLELNQTDFFGYSPLMHAAQNGHYLVAKLLIEKGALVYGSDAEGWTPLHFAAESGHWHIAEYLLSRKADPTATTMRMGETPLMKAAANGHLMIVKYLVMKTELDINAINKDGNTALMIAAFFGQLHIMRFLILHYADTEIKNKDGFTVKSLAPSMYAVKRYKKHKWLLQVHKDHPELEPKENEEMDEDFEEQRLPKMRIMPDAAWMPQGNKKRDKHGKPMRRVLFPPRRLPRDPTKARTLLLKLIKMAVNEYSIELETREEMDDEAFAQSTADSDIAEDEVERMRMQNELKKQRSRMRDAEEEEKERVIKAATFHLAGDRELVQGEYECARELYQIAMQYDPDDDMHQRAYNAADYHYSVVKYVQEEEQKQATRTARLQAEIRYATGNKYYNLGDYNEAHRWYKAAAMQEPTNQLFKDAEERAENKKRNIGGKKKTADDGADNSRSVCKTVFSVAATPAVPKQKKTSKAK